MSKEAMTYGNFQWLDEVQRLEPALTDDLNEVEQLARAIEEISLEHTELYTTS